MADDNKLTCTDEQVSAVREYLLGFGIDDLDRGEIEGILEAAGLPTLLTKLAEVERAATKARDTFLHYEQLHRLKCTSEGDEKADRNREMADMLSEALGSIR